MNQQAILLELEKQLSLNGLSEEVKQAIVIRLTKTILERITLSLVETLTEEEAEKLTTMQEQGFLNEVFDFLFEKHPELEGKVVVITRDVIAEFLAA